MNALAADLMSTLPPPMSLEQPRSPRFLRSIDLAALPTAMLCTRLFVASTLQRWGARFIEANAVMLAVELVSHSAHACGVTDEYVRLSQVKQVNIIQVRLLGFARSIGIEVWDDVTEPARLPNQDDADEPRGLGLVDVRAKNWGSAVTPQGRVVWAEMDVYERTEAGLPKRARKPAPCSRPSVGEGDYLARDVDFLRRLRDGLEGL